MEPTNNTVTTQTQVEVKKPSKTKAIIVAVLALVVFLGIQLLGSVIGGVVVSPKILAECNGDMDLYMATYLEYIQSQDFLTSVTIGSQIATVVILAIWYFFGFVKKTSKEEKAVRNHKVFTGKTLATAVLLGIGCYTFDVLLASIVGGLFPDLLDNFSGMMNAIFDFSSPLAFIAIVILAPLGEELVFRGVVLNSMRKAFPMWAAVIVSAALFAIAHVNPFQIIYVFPIALVLGYVGYRYKSIIPGIMIHLVNNFASIGSSKIIPESVLNNDVLISVIYAVIGVIAFATVTFIQKDNLKK